MTDHNDADNEGNPLVRRVQAMDLAGVAGRLAAMDEERRRREGAGLDISAVEAALARAKALAAEPGGAALAPAIAEREAALTALVEETRLKLAAKGTPEVGQGLRRLEEAVYREDGGVVGRGPVPRPAVEYRSGDLSYAALAEVDAALHAARVEAQALLKAALGLAMMPDQTGGRLDPLRHNVMGSETGSDPSRDNTVARQEAPGWLLGEEVLAPADVIRYTCATGGAPLLPDLDEVQERTVDVGMMGKRRVSGDE